MHPVKAAAASDVPHEVGATLVEQLFQIVEAVPCKGGDRCRSFLKAVDDAEAPVFGCHLFGQLLDHIDVDAEASRSIASGEHHGWGCHQAALATRVVDCQFQGSSSSILPAG